MANAMQYVLTYLDDNGEENVELIIAYSEEQARFFATDICEEDRIIQLECSVRRYACGF